MTPQHVRERSEHWLAGVERYARGISTVISGTCVADAVNVLLWSGDLVEENGLYRCTRAGWRVFNPRLRAVTGFLDATDLPSGMVVSGMGILPAHAVGFGSDGTRPDAWHNRAGGNAGLPWENAQPLGDELHVLVPSDAVAGLSQREREILDYCGWRVGAGYVVRWE